MRKKIQKAAVYKAVATLRLHGAVLTFDYPPHDPMHFVSRASCRATLPYFHGEIREDLAARIGHDRFEIEMEAVAV
jgi:hypothetical protein